MGNALFIIWRESAEAMLVVGILYAWLRKHPDMKRGMRYLWGGVGAGVGLALLLAAVMLGIATTLSDQGPDYFQLVMMLAAAGLIVQMVFWRRKNGRTFKRDLETAMPRRAATPNWWGLPTMAALAAEEAHEAAHGVLLPAGRFHDVGQSCALGPLPHRDDFGFLVAEPRSLIARRFTGSFLRTFPVQG